jgi:hypothetical protein
MVYGGLVLSILFLIASVVIFFLMDIPHAFGIVTGRTQKKAIEEIRAGGKAQVSKRRRVKESDILARDVSATSGSGIMRGRKSSSKGQGRGPLACPEGPCGGSIHGERHGKDLKKGFPSRTGIPVP